MTYTLVTLGYRYRIHYDTSTLYYIYKGYVRLPEVIYTQVTLGYLYRIPEGTSTLYYIYKGYVRLPKVT